MSSSAVVDVVIAVVLTFAVIALAASAIVEWIGNLIRKRAKYLLRGLRNMLDVADDQLRERAPGGGKGLVAAAKSGVKDEQRLYESALNPTGKNISALQSPDQPAGTSLTALIFDHPLLRSMMQPDPSPDATRSRVPPYVSSEIFARALIDTLVPNHAGSITFTDVREAIDELNPRMPARTALLSLADQSQGGLEEFISNVETWYDAQMDRVSGWYKRWAKRWIIVVATLLCVLGNIDAYAIAHTLYRDPVLRTAAVAQVQQGQACEAPGQRPEDQVSCVRNLVDAVNGTGRVVLWPEDCPSSPSACVSPPGNAPGTSDWLIKLLGLAITIAAAALGAPFWFDALNRLVNLRNTGKIPESKS